MNILENNMETLASLYDQFPNSFKDITMDGKYLVYNGEKVDISGFNIKDLLSDENTFASALSGLSPEDVFRIIRLHAMFINSKGIAEEKKDEVQEKVEFIKQENPLLANISVVRKNNGVGFTEYFNIVDSNGDDHLFENDRDVDILAIYEALRVSKGDAITPDELIEAINRRLYRIRLEAARTFEDSSTVSEDFTNKMNQVNDPYRDEKTVDVLGNEQSDIAIVADNTDVAKHQVVTFDKNEFGDLVTETHSPNVNGTETVRATDTSSTQVGADTTISADSVEDATVADNKEDEVVQTLIPEDEFYRLINAGVALSTEERRSVDLFYAYLGDLVLYEEYLMEELRSLLARFRAFAYDMEFGEHESINELQQEAVNKGHEFEEKKKNVDLADDKVLIQEEVQKLTLKYNQEGSSNRGSIATLLVIGMIVVTAILLIILSISALY